MKISDWWYIVGGGNNLAGNEGGLGLLGISVSLSRASKIKRDGMERKNNFTITKYPQQRNPQIHPNVDANSRITPVDIF